MAEKSALEAVSFENGFNFLFDVILLVLAFGGVPLVLAVHLEAYMFGQADHPCHPLPLSTFELLLIEDHFVSI